MVAAVDGSACGDGDVFFAVEILEGEGFLFGCHQLFVGALEDDFATVDTGSGADVDHKVGTHNHVAVVFHHDDTVAEVAEFFESIDEFAVVALVEADAGFVEDVEDVDEPCPYLCGEADTL